jgi:hypothetical protein
MERAKLTVTNTVNHRATFLPGIEHADLAANANTIKLRLASARHQELKIKSAAQGLEIVARLQTRCGTTRLASRRRGLMGL